MLAIELEFLLGRYFATDFRNDTKPEWPPHPDRLFEAMVAAHNDTFGSQEERSAIRWFETLGPPDIVAGQEGKPEPVVNFVPTNYDGTKSRSPHPDQRGKQPRSFPVQAPSSPVVRFVWPEAQPDADTQQRLAALLERIPSLGRACSLVKARLSNSFDTPQWRPDVKGQEIFRVFGEGRLAELEALHARGQRPTLGAQERYLKVDGSKSLKPQSCFSQMLVFRRLEGRPLPIEAALTLTMATRRALMAQAEAGGDHTICELISGHSEKPHLPVVALPFAGRQQYADGRLMGVALILPREISPGDRRRVVRLCASLEQINLKDRDACWKVELCGFDTPPAALKPETWMNASATWASVTPVLLDRFPKKHLPVEEILASACERIGLPSPMEVEHGPYSMLSGVPPVPEFRLIRKTGERPRWGVHVRLRFSAEVRGPVVLGAGRFFGLGLMKPTTWEEKPNDPQ